MASCMLDTFEQLSPNIYLHEPTSERLDDPLSPTLVVLCTWLGGATTRRISKYAIEYQQRFPSACILLITTTLSEITFRSFHALRQRLAPARAVVTRILQPTTRATHSPSTLLHIFSHGGCNTAIQLTRSLSDETDGSAFLSTLKLVVFDCCPGDTAFSRSYNAAALSLPPDQPANRIGKALLYPAMGVITSLQHLRVMNSVADLRSELNNPTLFGAPVRRIYLYSREDEMVLWSDVERHIEEARAKGFPADGVRFEHGSHCALVMADGARYWAAIERAWREVGAVGDDPVPVVEKSRL